jgi:cation diffusion facilitator family transporter
MGHAHHHHHHAPSQAQAADRYSEARHVTLVGSVVDALLGVAKIVVGVIGSSQALIADGIHSLSDLVTDVMVLVAMKHGGREADEEHPYGHGRIETLATVALGVALIAVGIGIAWDAVARMLSPERLLHPGWLALSVAVVSIVAKEIIYQYTMRAAERLNSNLLRANAWHSRSDAISSVVVVIGVIGSMAGLDYLDAVAAIGVAIMVSKIGVELAWHSSQELIDAAMEPEQVEKIRDVIQSVNGVQALHMLRTRRMGSDGLVDVHILVDPRISVSEGHRISDRVRGEIIRQVDAVRDVTVHIDPEDDEVVAPCSGLPMRDEVLNRLQQCWQEVEMAQYIEDTVLHYLDGKIHVEVLLPLERVGGVAEAQGIAQELSRLAQAEEMIADVKVRFH